MAERLDHLSGDTLCEYAEGLLDAAARSAADGHLQSCEQCRQELRVVQAYFTDMAALEPVRAPADFLTKVRARVERPAPLKTFWNRLSNPWRLIPAQLALLTLLGITILTVYLQQTGGLSKNDTPYTEPRSPAASLNAPASAPAPAATPAVSQKPIQKLSDAQTSDAKEELYTDDRISASQSERKRIAKSDLEKRQTDLEPAAPKKRAAGSASASEMGSATGALGKSRALAKSEAPASEAEPAALFLDYTLRLAVGKDSAAFWMGLQAMGAKVLRDEPQNASQGHRYTVSLPAAMQKDLQTYLTRYGSVESRKSILTSPDASEIRFRISVILP